jgi:hypothetical protein
MSAPSEGTPAFTKPVKSATAASSKRYSGGRKLKKKAFKVTTSKALV